MLDAKYKDGTSIITLQDNRIPLSALMDPKLFIETLLGIIGALEPCSNGC